MPNVSISFVGTLRPDQSQDKVEAIFVHVHHDTAAKETFHYVLMSSDGTCKQAPVFLVPGVSVRVVQCADESSLLDDLVKLVRR